MKDFEHDDPMSLQGVVLPGDTQQAMAETFVEELIKMGYPDEEILQIFQNLFYVAANTVLRERGEEYVRDLIRTTRSAWGPGGLKPAD